MTLYEQSTCSFVVRIWIEETEGEAGQASWRGHITLVKGKSLASKERKYFEALDEICVFISDYLTELGLDCTQGTAKKVDG